jgi:long-subunit fatty acid transport protein
MSTITIANRVGCMGQSAGMLGGVSRLYAVVRASGLALACCAGSMLGGVNTARAAEPDAATQVEPVRLSEPSRLSFSLRGYGEHSFTSDLDEGEGDEDGEVSVSRVGADFGVRYRATDKLSLSFDLGAEYSSYDFDNYTTVSGGGDPLEDVYLYQFSPRAAYKIDDRWSAFGGLILRWAGESDADFGDALTYGGLGGANYVVNDNLTLGFGVIVATRLEDDTFVIPILSIDWKINERWRLSNESRPGLALLYQASDTLTLILDANYTTRDYRLGDDNPIPEGAVEDTRVPVSFGARWRALDRLTLTGRVGFYAYSKFEFRNDDGDRVDSVDVDPGMFVAFEARVSF